MSDETPVFAPAAAAESAPPPAFPRDAARPAARPAAPEVSRAAVGLIALAFAALAGAGLLLWSAQGPAVFNEVVLAALAWCF